MKISKLNPLKMWWNKQNQKPNKLKTMKTGIVKFFNETKGFGFIKDDESSEDVFVHKTGTIDRLYENDKVEFEIQHGDKGAFASKVRVI
jgi:CspA family cold shock protein